MLKKPWETDTKDLPDVTFAPQQKPSYTGTTTTRHMSDYPIKLYTRLSVGQLYSLIMLRTTSTWEDFVCEVSNAWPAFMFDTLCFHFTVLPSSGKLGTVDKEAKAKFLSMSMYGDMSVVRDQDTWTEEVVNVACEYYWDKHEVINFGVIIR
ncbi:hypothetical protein DFH27DRAFT_583187 [Peziza echinospora]|nr:hypothetical protein DFH27DRAFT_583187 [Peziza echinospora]